LVQATRKRSLKGENRREQILAVATRLFARGGYNTVPLADIAAEVGITQAGLLHHFPSKSDLLMAMLEQRDQLNIENQKKYRLQDQSYFDSFLGALRRNEKSPELVQLFTVLSGESLVTQHPAHDWFKQRYDRNIQVATIEIGKTIDSRKLPEGVVLEDIARGIIALADGLRIQWLMDQDSVNRAEVIEKFVSMLEPYLNDSVDRSNSTSKTRIE